MFQYQLFGESHGKAIGVLVTHLPSGIEIDKTGMIEDLLRRASKGGVSTERKEQDKVEILSGVFEGKTTGMPLLALIRNEDTDDSVYEPLRAVARPGHADYAAYVKSGGSRDYRGGGHISGRLTAPLVVAGSLAKYYLQETCGITVTAIVENEAQLRKLAEMAKAQKNSVGGRIQCTVHGIRAGIGGPDLEDCLESEISRHVFAIPGVKAMGFGLGEGFATALGSDANDPLTMEDGEAAFLSNYSGGINGGISNGQDITFTVTFRPTPSIGRPQQTINMVEGTNTTLEIKGRHDACIALRAAPIVEAATALALAQFITDDTLEGKRRELDLLDEKITRLLMKRFDICKEIGNLKKEKNLPVENKEREAEVLELRKAQAGVYGQEIQKFYEALFTICKELQQ